MKILSNIENSREIDNYIINLNKLEIDKFILFINKYSNNLFSNKFYVNSTLSLSIRKLIEFNIYCEIEYLNNLFNLVSINHKIKANSINDFINYIYIFNENISLYDFIIINKIIANNLIKYDLWLKKEFYVKYIHFTKNFINILNFKSESYFNCSNNKYIVKFPDIIRCFSNIRDIIFRFPYFQELDLKDDILNINFKISLYNKTNVEVLYNKKLNKLVKSNWDNILSKYCESSKHPSKKKKWIKSYEIYTKKLETGNKNLIVDGMNTFYYSESILNGINLKKLNLFIKKNLESNEYDNIIIVFYIKHYNIIKESQFDFQIKEIFANEIKINEKISIIFSPLYKDDDMLSLYLWLSSPNNYIMTKDNFTNHVKKFHDNLYNHGLWEYYILNKKISY